LETPQLFPIEGPLCPRCPWREDCGAMYGDKACRATWKAKSYGGRQALHPSSRIASRFMENIGGSSFNSIRARAQRAPALPPYLNQIRMRRVLRGQLTEPAYAITAGQVIGNRSRPLRAAEVRNIVGLSDDQLLVLLLFGHDKWLERLWDNRHRFIPELALGGYDLIVAPSFSAWEPRPRLEHLYAFKRSMVVFEALQKSGATAISRVAFAVQHDVLRTARWVTENPDVASVGLDLTTYRGEWAFAEQLELLEEFDRLTSHRLSFLINGPSRFDRLVEVFTRLDPDRVQISNSRAIARNGAPGASYAEKAETERETVLAARRAAAPGAEKNLTRRQPIAART
jgi:hypothetical protein